jgi:serine phosphatase RsbU (regulator of sigma subunit)
MIGKVDGRRLWLLLRKGAQQLRGLYVIPLLLLLAIVVTDLSTSRNLEFNRFLAVVPALAAALLSAAGTICLGLLSFVCAAALASYAHQWNTASPWLTMGMIIAVTMAGAYASEVRQRRERSLAEVRAVADVAQQVLLRPVPRRLGQVDLEVLYQAAAARAKIGGDFYEALQTRRGVRLVIGDVRGKGLQAVEVASVMLGSFREAAHDAADLPDLARRLETSMSRYVRGEDMLECFVTLLLVEIPADEPIARLVNCGHPAPLLLHGEEVLEFEPAKPSPPMNMADLLGDEYYVETIPFFRGDRLLLYTDGVIETRDSAGVFYPLNQRVRQWTSVPLRTLLDQLHRDLIAYSSGVPDDDLAAVIAHRCHRHSDRHSETARAGARSRGFTTRAMSARWPDSPGPA